MNPLPKIILPLALIAIVGTGIYYVSKPVAQTQPIQKACSMEAKLCPDGSAVGRTGPNCEFTACPDVINLAITSGIRGIVLLGPTCPVERIPPDPNCAEKPFQTSFILTRPNSSQVLSEFSSDQAGKFNVNIPAGDYIIKPAPGAPMLPRCPASDVITVEKGAYTSATISCDTGIR